MTRTAMFPLGTVLMPGALLPLHVFEPRYRAMMSDLTAPDASKEFGVVLIDRGSEVGGGEERRSAGTLARLVDWQVLPDGRWVTVAVGVERIHVNQWLADDPYPAAETSPLPDAHVALEELSNAVKTADRNVRRSLALAAELGHDVTPVTFALADDPVEALWQLCAAAPLGPFDAQRLLEDTNPVSRARSLTAAADELASVLAFRLSGG